MGCMFQYPQKILLESFFFGKKVLLINIKDTKTSIVCITLFMAA